MSAARPTVTVRRGPKVERTRCDSLAEALALVESRGRELAHDADVDAVQVPLGRRIEPAQRVFARIEVALGPLRRGGVDVRGDGSVEAYAGWLRRRALERRRRESAYDALRRELGAA